MNKITNTVKHPLVSGSLIMIIGSMGANVVNYVYHLVMGRTLGRVEYGILASLYSILYIISIVPISSSVGIVRFISKAHNPKEKNEIYIKIREFIFKIAVVGSISIVLISPLLANFIHIDNVWNILIIAPIFFLTLMTLVNQAAAQAELIFLGVVIPNITLSIVKLVAGIILVFIGMKVFGAMTGVLLGALIAYLFSEKYIKRYFNKNNSSNFNLKPFLKYSAPALAQALAFTSLFTVDVLLVKHFFSPDEAGIYASLSTLGKIIYFAAQPITGVMFPIISKKESKKEKYSHVLVASLGLTSLISFGIVGFYTLFGDIAVKVLFGPDFADAKNNIVLMGLFISFYTVSYMLTNFFLSIGKTNVVFVTFAFAIAQVILIIKNHNSLTQVITISLLLMVILSLFLAINLLYNIRHGKSKITFSSSPGI